MKATVVPLSEYKKENRTATSNELETVFGFVVRTGRRDFILIASDALERDDWMEAIKENCL